jgi:hypothetical protein
MAKQRKRRTVKQDHSEPTPYRRVDETATYVITLTNGELHAMKGALDDALAMWLGLKEIHRLDPHADCCHCMWAPDLLKGARGKVLEMAATLDRRLELEHEARNLRNQIPDREPR